MAAKRIQVSDDGGTTFWTLPGSSGEKRTEMAAVADTVFGQDYASEDQSIGNWMVTANAYFKSVAGYIANLKIGGSATVMTAEALSLVSGKTYQITNVTKRQIDYETALQVFDNAVDQTANVESIDYLNGTVTFKSAYTINGPVTLTGKYIPTTVLAKSRSFNLTQGAAEIDTTTYEVAQANGGWRTYEAGLKTARLEVGGIFDATADAIATLATRSLLMMEVSPNNSTDTLFRGFFKRSNHGQSGDVGALEEQTQTFSLFVPDGQLISRPFGWYITPGTTKLNKAVQIALAAWQTGAPLKLRYLPDGTTGKEGDAIVTEATLANSYEGLNEFRFSFRGTGQQTAVP